MPDISGSQGEVQPKTVAITIIPPSTAIGRPSGFSQALADEICGLIAEGRSLRSICMEEAFPCMATVFNWLNLYPQFVEKYERARAIQAEGYADQIVQLSDDCRLGEKVTTKSDGKIETVVGDMVERSKLQVDARKWVASRLLPKKYGDISNVRLTGADGGPVVFALERVGEK